MTNNIEPHIHHTVIEKTKKTKLKTENDKKQSCTY